ncbi:MAG: rhodanese-like domain-containing protein [Planctomycetia bacterium]|nr:rhodanese-like domain-containing protein [Planctomycetia bacterium]
MSRLFWGATAALVLSGVVRAAEHTTDTLETVKKNVKDGKAVLVDVREADEWKDGHLKDAKHIALSDLKKGVPADELKKTLPAGSVVYLHCASGKRCLAAADILKKQGYDVRPLKDGYQGLVKNGFPQDK